MTGKKEDLGIKIGSHDEAAWTTIKEQSIKELENNKRAIIIGKAIIELAEKEILKAVKEFKADKKAPIGVG